MGKLKAVGKKTPVVKEESAAEKGRSIIPVELDKNIVIAKDEPGEYIVDTENLIVCDDMEFLHGEKFEFLEKGTRIKVVELAGTRDGIWRRARIQPAPAGFKKAWIGLVNLKDGKRVASRV